MHKPCQNQETPKTLQTNDFNCRRKTEKRQKGANKPLNKNSVGQFDVVLGHEF